MAKGDIIVYRNPRTYSQAYGTAAYTVSRAGMARILNSYWPGGEHGPAYSALPRGARFTTRKNIWGQACPGLVTIFYFLV